jgi:hypothetical protein
MLQQFKRKTTAAIAAAAIVFAAVASAPVTTVAASGLTLPVAGTVVGGGTFTNGTFTITKFAVQNGQVVATGILSGVLTTVGGIATTILQTVTLPVQVGQTTCDILHLDIGPISLNLLGLQVDLSRIVLDITAQAGAGNLLGNLLCAVAGLLDNPGGLAKLLNQILGILTA